MRTLSAVPITELCTNVLLNLRHLSIEDSQLGPNGVQRDSTVLLNTVQ